MLRRCAAAGITLVLSVFSVEAQTNHHPPQDQALHEKFYNTWKRPNEVGQYPRRTMSCCGMGDCYPTAIRHTATGLWQYRERETGNWRSFDPALLEENQSDPRESPDGRAHVCAPPSGALCVVRGSGL